MSKREQEANASPSQTQRDQQEAINRTLDQTRNNVRKTVSEAQKDVSDYARQVITLQEKAFETTRNIAESYIESQREIFNSFNQSVWNPYIENVAKRTPAFYGMFSLPGVEACTNTVGNIVDNFVTVTRMVNKTVFANAGLINTSLQQVSNNAMEYSTIGINATKNIHGMANELAKIGVSVAESTPIVRRSQ